MITSFRRKVDVDGVRTISEAFNQFTAIRDKLEAGIALASSKIDENDLAVESARAAFEALEREKTAYTARLLAESERAAMLRDNLSKMATEAL